MILRVIRGYRRWLGVVGAAVVCVTIAAARGRTAQPSPPREIAVAAASDLQAVLPVLASGFQRDTGTLVKASFGSSGNFFAQIHNGAPFDVFMSADIDYARRLVSAGDAEAGSLYTYATGHLVLWTRTGSGIDVKRGLEVLRDPRVRRIAVANPDVAPYGRAAVAALRQQKLYDAVRSKLVLGENIAQTAQFAASGNADVGLIGLSLAVGPALKNSGTYEKIPASAYPAIEQAAVVISRSQRKDRAREFLMYLRGRDAGTTLARFGFDPPPSATR